ncbi:MAG: type II toxin-antitoxin system prevent-host-death family antitoxin [Chloroflexia bacterium]
MAAVLTSLDDLPRHPASHVKNRWGEVVRQVRESGSVAVTSHSVVEMVLVDTATYRRLVEDAGSMQARERAVLDQLNQAFEARLASLQVPASAGQVDALFATRGRLTRRPKAGATF